MTAIPRHVTTAEEGAARIAGWIFGDGNPEHSDGPLGGSSMTALSTEGFVVPECTRIATDLLGWTEGHQFRINTTNGNFICLAAPLYAALNMPINGNFYHTALTSIVPTRKQVEAFLASVIEGEGGGTGSGKVLDESRAGELDRKDNMAATCNTQGLGAVVSGKNVNVNVPALDAFPLPLLSAARYPGITPADWPDGSGGGGGGSGGGGTGVGFPHIMLIVMENRGYDAATSPGRYVVGHSEFPKVNALLGTYVRFSSFWAAYGPNGGGSPTTTGSHPNYPPLVGGSNFSIVNDNVSANPGTGLTNQILFDQLTAVNVSWAAYAEDLGSDLTADVTRGNGLTYIARHAAPIADFAKYNVNPPLVNIKDPGSTLGFGSGTPSWPTLIADLNAADPPAFVWFTPTANNQGHGNGPTTGVWAGDSHADPDNFLAKIIADVQATSWYAAGGNIIVWWDDGADTHTNPTVQSGLGQTMCFVVSHKAQLRASRTINTPLNSFGLLHDIEAAYGVPFLNHAGDTPTSIGAGALALVLDTPTTDTTPPPVPTGLTATAFDPEISTSWTAVTASDLAGYRLYRDGVLTYAGVTPSYLDTGLTGGVTYTYQVSSYDTSGNESGLSAPASATPSIPVIAPPDPPVDLHASADITTIGLSWTASPSANVAVYRVYRGSLLIAEVPAIDTFYVDTGLTPSTVYTYRVSAFSTTGEESTSTPFISATTLAEPTQPPPITQTPLTVTATIGCAESYAVYVAHRSGSPLLTELPITGVDWNRVQDDVSVATTTLDLVNGFEDCCRAVNGLARYGFEIVVFRNGIRVHTGPVVDILPSGENISIRSEDKMGWLKVRPIFSALDYPDPGVDVADIFNAVISNAMSPDNVPGLVATATATGVRAARTYAPNPPQLAYDAIQELARSGVDYTMIGPTMVAGSFVVPTPPIAFLTDQSVVGIPNVELLGANFATSWYVTGDPEANLIANYGGVDPLSGLVVRLAAEDTIKDQASLNQNAKSRWEISNGPAVGEASLVLDPSAAIPIQVIVPGAVIDLRIAESCFPLIGRYRLKEASFSYAASDAGASETITLTVQPIGTEVIT